MNPRSKALALATMAAVGCTPTRSELRKEANALQPAMGLLADPSANAQVIAPKRCELTLATLSRPLNDPALNEALWGAADEQAFAPEVRRALEANGLRIGLIAGHLPREVEDVLNAPPPDRVEPSHVQIYNGENTLYSVCPAIDRVALMLSQGDRVAGKDYTDAGGFLRLTAGHDGPNGVSLRIVPEVHHGPIRHGYVADASTSPFAVQQFVMRDGQQEDTLRELAASIAMGPGHVLAIGCRPDRALSLGHFLFTEREANSDRLAQKVLLIRARQAQSDPPTIQAGTSAEPSSRATSN